MPQDWSRYVLSRRHVLKILAGSAGTTVSLPVLTNAMMAGAGHAHGVAHSAQAPSGLYVPKFFNPHQMQTLAEMAEIIIPTDDHSPGAKAARVEEFMDEVIAVREEKEKELWTKGLAALDQTAELEFGKSSFLDLTGDQKQNLVGQIAGNEEHPLTLEERFFIAVKAETVTGYYNSAIGIHHEIQYQGNQAQMDFQGCTHEEHRTGIYKNKEKEVA